MIKDTSIEQGDVRIEAGNTHTIIYAELKEMWKNRS